MGDGLADNRPDYLATEKECCAQPLSGLGLPEKTTRIVNYLHDHRARTIEDAILWHDFEAKNAQELCMW
jgi:CxxC motif-containing protein (DUF1111 family)